MTDITRVMVEEHKLILRMAALLEERTARAREGSFTDWNFFLTAVDFIRNYADAFHHAKEEAILFTALVANGMPEKSSPIEAMLIAHDQGRAWVRGMERAAQQLLAGEADKFSSLATNAEGYIAMIRDHIAKEDDILYPLAERVLPESVRPAMVEGYAAAEARTPELEAHYQALVAAAESIS